MACWTSPQVLDKFRCPWFKSRRTSAFTCHARQLDHIHQLTSTCSCATLDESFSIRIFPVQLIELVGNAVDAPNMAIWKGAVMETPGLVNKIGDLRVEKHTSPPAGLWHQIYHIVTRQKDRKVKFTKVVMQWCFTLQSFWEWLTHRVLQAKVSEESVSKAAVQVGKTGESLAHQAGLGKRELGKIWINTRDTLNLFHLFEGCYKYR